MLCDSLTAQGSHLPFKASHLRVCLAVAATVHDYRLSKLRDKSFA